MTKELRALAIVFGVLAGLVVLGFAALAIAFGFAVKHVASAQRDPAALRRTVGKIATFSIPRGYEIASATDFGFSLTASLRPVNRSSAFRIQLQGSTFPTSGNSQSTGTALGMTFAERLLGCEPAAATTVEVAVGHARAPLNVMHCTRKNGDAMQVEFITFPGNVASVSLSAIGTGNDFDESAVRELLASVK
jgi:hypothetical protein